MPTPPRPIKAGPSRSGSIARSPFSASYLSASPIAQESIARDLAEWPDDDIEAPESDSPSSEDESSGSSTVRPETLQHSMANSYRRPSFVAFGGTRPAIAAPHPQEVKYLTKKEKKQSRDEERSLLRDNHVMPPKHPEPPRRSALNRLYRRLFSTKIPKSEVDEEAAAPLFTAEPSETSALLGNTIVESSRSRHERLNAQREDQNDMAAGGEDIVEILKPFSGHICAAIFSHCCEYIYCWSFGQGGARSSQFG
jgi:MATE family multidrug resistance protein